MTGIDVRKNVIVVGSANQDYVISTEALRAWTAAWPRL